MTLKPVVSGRRYMVASGHPLASMAGAEVMRAGGNAIDAGVAAGLALEVLESTLVGFGGVAPIILYSAEHDETVTISGLGTWPAAIDRDFFMREHGGQIPPGILRTVVPAAPDAWITALARYGRMGFADVAAFAIEYAREGFRTYEFFHNLLAEKRDVFARHPSTAAIYLPGGAPPPVGSLFRQTALADSIAALADADRAAAAKGGRAAGLAAARALFYEGDMAARMVAHVQAEGGVLTREDLAGFRVEVAPPVSVQFGDWQVQGCGPWCQGPMLLQALKILDGVDLPALGHNSADYIHTLVEAVKLAAEDRDSFYGDPNFTDVPMGRLLSDAHATVLRARIRMDRARRWGEPPDAPEVAAERAAHHSAMDTSYACAVDAEGNAFSATPSDAPHHAPVVPDLGFVVSARGTQSWADPNHPSGVAPGKRPRLTPNPALAVGPGGRRMPFGSPGGDVQTQAMLQGFLNHVVFGMDLQTATEAPRFATFDFPSSWSPHDHPVGLLRLEATLDASAGADLAARGHDVQPWPERSWTAGALSMIEADRGTGEMVAGSDPRREGQAVGW